MKNIEPNCLALITNSTAPENIGKTVRCLRLIQPNTKVLLPNGFMNQPSVLAAWVVETVDGSKSLLVPIRSLGLAMPVNSGSCRENWLMRIGDDVVVNVLKKVVENVE